MKPVTTSQCASNINSKSTAKAYESLIPLLLDLSSPNRELVDSVRVLTVCVIAAKPSFFFSSGSVPDIDVYAVDSCSVPGEEESERTTGGGSTWPAEPEDDYLHVAMQRDGVFNIVAA